MMSLFETGSAADALLVMMPPPPQLNKGELRAEKDGRVEGDYMPKHIVVPVCSLVVPDTEPNSSTLPVGFQSVKRVERKERNAADNSMVVSISVEKPVLPKIFLSQIKSP